MKNLVSIINQIYCMVRSISQLESRVESLEHFSNQQSLLLDTLGNIMEELKKQERSLSMDKKQSKKDTLDG